MEQTDILYVKLAEQIAEIGIAHQRSRFAQAAPFERALAPLGPVKAMLQDDHGIDEDVAGHIVAGMHAFAVTVAADRHVMNDPGETGFFRRFRLRSFRKCSILARPSLRYNPALSASRRNQKHLEASARQDERKSCNLLHTFSINKHVIFFLFSGSFIVEILKYT